MYGFLNWNEIEQIKKRSLFISTGWLRQFNGFCFSLGAISSLSWPSVTRGWKWHLVRRQKLFHFLSNTALYRLNVTYFKIPQSDGISPRLYLHLPLKKLFLNWMLLEKNNEEVKKPEQKCLVLFSTTKTKKSKTFHFLVLFSHNKNRKEMGNFLI